MNYESLESGNTPLALRARSGIIPVRNCLTGRPLPRRQMQLEHYPIEGPGISG